MLSTNFSDLACEYSEIVYDKFLEEVYGVNPCTDFALYDDPEDYQLLLVFAKSGYKTAEELADMNIDLELLGKASGVRNFYYVNNNTNIINNYTINEYTSSGYVHVQNTASTTWLINNPLEFCPNVALVDENGDTIGGQITYSANCDIITINFNTPLKGKAYLS